MTRLGVPLLEAKLHNEAKLHVRSRPIEADQSNGI